MRADTPWPHSNKHLNKLVTGNQLNLNGLVKKIRQIQIKVILALYLPTSILHDGKGLTDL